MAFLLDQNIVSETIRPRLERAALDWIEAQIPNDLYLAARTIGEIVRGARKVEEQARRERYERWIERDLARWFNGRALLLDGRAVAIGGRLVGDSDRDGRSPALADAHIAAVAIHHELILVTRNVKEFANFEIQLLDPLRNHIDDDQVFRQFETERLIGSLAVRTLLTSQLPDWYARGCRCRMPFL